MTRQLTSEYSVQMGFAFDRALGSNLEYWRNAVLHQDIDCGIIVDGGEGYGKSVLAMQIAKFMDVDRTIDIEKQICYTPEQFKTAVDTLPKGKAVVWDEARRGVNRRRSGQDINLEITDMLAECRQKNLFLIIVMPSFYDMDMNVAVWRTRILVHVTAYLNKNNRERPLVRGMFRFYSEEAKKKLFTNIGWRKGYRYPFIGGASFDGRFSHNYVVDEKQYRDKKKAAMGAFTKTNKFGSNNQAIGNLLNFLNRNRLLYKNWKQRVSEHYNVSERTIDRWRQTDTSSVLLNEKEEKNLSLPKTFKQKEENLIIA